MSTEKADTNSIILLRGLPGSGKTTLANLLSENGKYPVLSVDDYFTNENGEYRFNYQENHLAYQKCENQVAAQCKKGTSKVFVDNTFTLEWEMKPYFEIAGKYNYSIYIVTVENYHGGENVHGVAAEQLAKMAAKYHVKLLP